MCVITLENLESRSGNAQLSRFEGNRRLYTPPATSEAARVGVVVACCDWLRVEGSPCPGGDVSRSCAVGRLERVAVITGARDQACCRDETPNNDTNTEQRHKHRTTTQTPNNDTNTEQHSYLCEVTIKENMAEICQGPSITCPYFSDITGRLWKVQGEFHLGHIFLNGHLAQVTIQFILR